MGQVTALATRGTELISVLNWINNPGCDITEGKVSKNRHRNIRAQKCEQEWQNKDKSQITRFRIWESSKIEFIYFINCPKCFLLWTSHHWIRMNTGDIVASTSRFNFSVKSLNPSQPSEKLLIQYPTPPPTSPPLPVGGMILLLLCIRKAWETITVICKPTDN